MRTSDDRAALEKLIPEETVAIKQADNIWENRKAIFEGAASSQKPPASLSSSSSPRLKFRSTGLPLSCTPTIHTNWRLADSDEQGGRVTEVFVLRKGQWVNPGWHMDSGK